MEKFSLYFILFIIYSFIGWLIEEINCLIELKKIVNRGFLIGPICPIYGYGVLSIVLLIGNSTHDILGVFLKSIMICAILEYFTSYFMEKLFNARWWDYSKRKFNINGRICLETMIPFGILGTFIIYVIHPLIKNIVNLLNPTFKIIIAIILLLIYLIDNVISFNVLNKIKWEIKKQHIDNTEKIRKDVLEWMEKNSILFSRIKNAFPRFKVNNKKSND